MDLLPLWGDIFRGLLLSREGLNLPLPHVAAPLTFAHAIYSLKANPDIAVSIANHVMYR